MAQSILRRVCKRGIHKYNRYTIQSVSTYEETTTYDSAIESIDLNEEYMSYWDIIIGTDCTYDSNTGEYMFTKPFTSEDVYDYIMYTYKHPPTSDYYIFESHAPTIPYRTRKVAKISKGTISPNGRWLRLAATIMESKATGTTKTKGTYVDTIVTSQTYPSNGVSGNYWYELVL